MDHSKNEETFIQEYAYVEELPPEQLINEEKKEAQEERGIYIIDLFSQDD